MANTLEQISENLIQGNIPEVVDLVKKALDDGADAQEVLNRGLMPGMVVVGDRFKRDEMYVPEVLVSAQAMKEASAILKPLLSKSDVKAKAKIVIGTVKGDLHDIGKNIVGMMLEGSGYEVLDLGIDVPAEKFTEAVKDHGAAILGISAMLTTTMVEMKNVVKAVKEAGMADKVKVLVGGAPVNQDFADEIGAHGYAADAGFAVDKVAELVKA